MAGPKLTERRPGSTVRIKFVEKDKLLLSENKIVIRGPERAQKEVIMVRAKVKIMVIVVIAIIFVNIYCFIILIYPISPNFTF